MNVLHLFMIDYNNTNKIMSQLIQQGHNFMLSNPQAQSPSEIVTYQIEKIDPQTYKLNQNYFHKQDLVQQKDYQIQRTKQNVYFGGAYNNMKHGWGVYITKTSLFQGQFSLNHKMGKGYAVFSNGSTFTGDFVNDKPHGHGILTMGEEYYMGDFENGAMQGDGLWKNGKGERYVGRWKNNKAHGQGIYITEKSNYQGHFNQFVKQGYGVESFTNGDQYIGYYQNGKPHGNGKYIWANKAVYKGQFQAGMRQGEGQWTSEHGDQYKGHYSSDRKNGQGQFKWVNGNSYKGEFCEDMRQGQGIMSWTDGSMYEGQWRRGLPNGRGMFKAKGQKPRVGVFEDNILVTESKTKQFYIPSEISKQSQTQFLGMIPEQTRRKPFYRRRNTKSVSKNTNLPSANSTRVTFKVSKRANNRSSKK